MPIAWTALPPAIWNLVPDRVMHQIQSTQVAPELVVTARRSVYDRENNRFTFEDGVAATFGVTSLSADKLVIDRKAGIAHAEGKVILTDPDGIMRAEDLDIELNENGTLKAATANRVGIDVAGIKLTAARADILPARWEFADVSVTNCRQNPPFLRIRSPRIVLTPGKRGRATNPRLDFFGKQILKLPSQSFLLDPRADGIRLPSLNYRKDDGAGVSWDSSILLSDRSVVAANAASFPRSFPAYGIQYTASRLDYNDSRAKIATTSELRERFKYGYLETVEVTSPEQEPEYMGQKRASWSIGSQWNQRPVARSSTQTFNKPLEITGEAGGLLPPKPDRQGSSVVRPGFLPAENSLGWNTQVRLQSIQPSRGNVTTRITLQGAIQMPVYVIHPGIETLARVDGNVFAGNGSYGWERSMLGLVVRPVRQVTVGAAWVNSNSFGRAQFAMDELYATSGYHFRADADLGPTKLSLLWKWDRHRRWYDREYQFSQVVGCIEPFAVYRQFPGDYRIGLRFRLENFRALIQRRDYKRADSAQQLERRVLFGKPN